MHPKLMAEKSYKIDQKRFIIPVMNFVLYILRRYLRSRRQGGFLRFLTSFTRLGITLGVGVLVVTLSIMNGYKEKITEFILDFQPHLRMTYQLPTPFPESDRIKKELDQNAQIKRIWPVVEKKTLLQYKRKVVGADITALTPDGLAKLEGLFRIVGQEDPKGTLYLGEGLATRLGVKAGDRVAIITNIKKKTTMGLSSSYRKNKIRGVFRSGMFELDNSKLFLDLPEARKIFGLEKKRDHRFIPATARPFQRPNPKKRSS